MKRYGNCVQCGECCQSLRITAVLSNIISQHGSFEEAKNYYSFRGITLTHPDAESDTLCLELPIACDKIDENNGCTLHDQPEKKPVICHRYPWYPDEIASCGYKWK